MQIVINETYTRLMETLPLERNDNLIQTESLLYKVICVLWVDFDYVNEYGKPYIAYQNFRISLKTAVKDIIEIACRFWEISDQQDDYNLRYVDENKDLHKIEEKSMNDCLDNFLKSKNGIKKAKLIKVKKEAKAKDGLNVDDQVREFKDSITKKKTKKTQFKSFEFGEVTKKFLQRFVEVSAYMNSQINKIYLLNR
jgi:hypothetical protein